MIKNCFVFYCRFGTWSPEAKALNLPSYAPTFVFLSIIPLEIMQEYMRMKLESRPITPNPLSLEQLIKELREGLILSITHRERCNRHVQTALLDRASKLEKYMKTLDEFNATVKDVLSVSLIKKSSRVLQHLSNSCQYFSLHFASMYIS